MDKNQDVTNLNTVTHNTNVTTRVNHGNVIVAYDGVDVFRISPDGRLTLYYLSLSNREILEKAGVTLEGATIVVGWG